MQIIDVAKAAGVSPATVSRVLNNSCQVSEKTRIKVLTAVKEMEYHPNQMGQNLRTQRSNMLLVLVSDMGNSYFSDILYGMDETAQSYGYNLFVASTYFSPEREQKMLTLLNNKTVDGAILLASNLTQESIDKYDVDFPIIQCCDYLESSTAAHVSIDNYSASYQVMKLLIDSGHKRIAFLEQHNTFISTILRKQAYMDALRDYGLPYDPAIVKSGDHTFDFGVSGTQELLRLKERPTAIFAISDRIAVGALRALAMASIDVPSEMAVIGFDNIDISRMTTPPLSTVAQPMRLIGNTAVKMLMDRMNGKEISKEIFLDYEIVLRKST